MDIRGLRLATSEAIEIKLEDIDSDSESLPEQIPEPTVKCKEFNEKMTTGPKELDSETNYISVNAGDTPNKKNNEEFIYACNIVGESVELLDFNETNSKRDVECVGRDEPNFWVQSMNNKEFICLNEKLQCEARNRQGNGVQGISNSNLIQINGTNLNIYKPKNVLQKVVNCKQILKTRKIVSKEEKHIKPENIVPMKIEKIGSDEQIRENGIIDLTGVESVLPKNDAIQKTGNGEQLRKNRVIEPVGEVTGQAINRDLQNGQTVNANHDKYRTDKIIYDEEIVLTIKGHKCAYCNYESTSRLHIKHHIRFNHRDQAIHKKRKQKKQQCPHCPKQTTHLCKISSS